MGDVFDVLEDGVQEAEVILLVVDHECPGIGGLRPLEVVQAHELVFVLGARFLNLLGQPGGDVHATFELLPGRGEVRALAEQVPEPDSVVCVDAHSISDPGQGRGHPDSSQPSSAGGRNWDCQNAGRGSGRRRGRRTASHHARRRRGGESWCSWCSSFW